MNPDRTNRGSLSALGLLTLTVLLTLHLGGCRAGDSHEHEHTEEEDSWAVTAWGEHFEIFAEADPLVAGAVSTSHTHVTLLSDFSPLRQGVVTAILRDSDGSQQTFRQDQALRDGIFSIEIEPMREGQFELWFGVETSTSREEILASRVRVGTAADAGGLVDVSGSEGSISFLKEQQWRTEFATEWVREGTLELSVRGPGRVRTAAGGEDLLTAAVDGSVLATPWPYPGQRLRSGTAVFRLTPAVASDRSLAELDATVRGLEAELELVRGRRARLIELLDLGAVSERETEENRARLVKLAAQAEAARHDLESARALRQGSGTSTETIEVVAPFGGRIAEVLATPGQTVLAGSALARMVKEEPLWVEVALRPEAARTMTQPSGLLLRTTGGETPLTFAADQVRWISQAPGVDAATGTVGVLLEVESTVDQLPLRSAVDAEILLAGERAGVVIPASALVDDGGVTVVYLQPSGEGFERQEVQVVARQGSSALVEGLPKGERLVTRGGNAIRRATLVSAGPGEGHVH